MDTYRATNTKNGKFYIGSTVNFKRRKRAHLTSQENYPFQRALRKNPEAFEWEVWSDDSDEPVLEQALLDMWFGKEQCYNLNPFADRPVTPDHKGDKNPNYGKSPSEETRKKLSLAKSGENHPMYGITGSLNPCYGIPRPGHVKQRLREVNTGKKDSEQTKAKKSAAHKGKKWWVNEKGETTASVEKPGPEWQMGRKWKG
jgi:group I intron endonuclease